MRKISRMKAVIHLQRSDKSCKNLVLLNVDKDDMRMPPTHQDRPRLLDQVRAAIRLKHYSIRTEQAYLGWIKRFILFHNKRHPVEMGKLEIEVFLTNLAVQGQVAAFTQNQALNALMFLYREVLHKEMEWLKDTIRAKRPTRLPVVLTPDEVRNLLAHLEGTRWLMASLLYGSGLRLMECLRLRVKDLDFTRRELIVRDGKGAKDRVTMLSEKLIEPLQLHLEQIKTLYEADLKAGFGAVYLPYALERKYPNANREWGWQYVFPASKRSSDPRSGTERRHHMAETVLQQAVKRAVRSAGIVKPASCHTFRHSF
jgi:integron integrase